MAHQDEVPPPQQRVTPEQLRVVELYARVFRIFGTAVLAFIFVIGGALAVLSACALAGVLPVLLREPSGPWAGVLAISLVGCILCPLLVRYLHRMTHRAVDRVRQSAGADGPGGAGPVSGRAAGAGLSVAGHLALQIGAAAVGALVAFVLFFVFVLGRGHHPVVTSLAFALAMGAGWGLPRAAVRLLPARCERCGGPAYCRGSRPVTYACRSCGHAGDTGVHEEAGGTTS